MYLTQYIGGFIMARPRTDTTKIVSALSNRLIAEMDEQCDKLNISRTAYISMALTEKLKNDKMLEQVPDMLQAIATIKDLANADETQIKQLKQTLADLDE